MFVQMRLGGFLGMVFGVQAMAVRGVGMFGRFLMRILAMMLGGEAMVLGGVFVMFRRLVVMVGNAVPVRHCAIPPWADRSSATAF